MEIEESIPNSLPDSNESSNQTFHLLFFNASMSSFFASGEIGCMGGLFRNYLFYSFTLLAQFEVLFEFVLVINHSANTAIFQEGVAHIF